MKTLALFVYKNQKIEKLIEWGKLVTITGSAQIVVQVIGLISGILIIRILPTEEYALYTLTNAMLSTMVALADGGISASVMAQSGKFWKDKEKLRVVLATGFDLRKKFAVGSLIIAVPILFFLLHYHGSSWMMSGVITVSLIPIFFTTLYGHLLEIIPKLKQDITQLQKVQVSSNIMRLFIVAASIIFFPRASIALFVTAIPQIWANKRLFDISNNFVNWQVRGDSQIRKEILSYVKLSLPNAIYYSLSGQVIIWLISIFGSTEAVAQVGALGRLALILMVFSNLFATLVAPRFSKLPNRQHILLKRYLQVLASLIGLTILIVSAVYLFPKPILWILGKGYSDLDNELLLIIIGSCLNLIVGSTFALYSSRGWVIKPLITIGANVITVIIGALLLDISTLKGILLFNIFQAIGGMIISFWFAIAMIKG